VAKMHPERVVSALQCVLAAGASSGSTTAVKSVELAGNSFRLDHRDRKFRSRDGLAAGD
jgi:hypothetical protein